MKPREVMLLRNNQFGHDGPQAGDKGTATAKFFIPDIEFPWYRVDFEDHDEGSYSVPAGVLHFLD